MQIADSNSTSSIVYCTAEDRSDCDTGVKLLALSFSERCSAGSLVIFHKNPSAGLLQWLNKYPRVIVRPWLARGEGWNCKPEALLTMLDEGFSRVVWLDTDLMLSRDPTPFFVSLDPATFVASQEPLSVPHQGTEIRVRAWQEEVGQSFSSTLNSCVIHASPVHRPLLEAWRDWLDDARYRDWFKIPQPERPFYVKGDQDVLNVVVGSKRFRDSKVRLLESGTEIIHSGGALYFGIVERLRYLQRGNPYFIHAIAMKPWVMLGTDANLKGAYWAYRKLAQEVSPFVALSRAYRDQLGESTDWLDYRTPLGLLMRALGFGSHVLRGLPLSAVAALLKLRSSTA